MPRPIRYRCARQTAPPSRSEPARRRSCWWRWIINLRIAAFAVLLHFSAAVSLGAQTVEEPLEPDRPDVTNGSRIVGVGLLQLEIGGIYTNGRSDQGAFGSPVTARVGILDWLEVRFGSDGLLTESTGDTRATGIGNIQLGAKLRLLKDKTGAPLLSILPSVNLPTADTKKGLGSGVTDYTVALLTGSDIGERAHVDVNYGIGGIGDSEGQPHFLQHLFSISASVSATEKSNPYVEAFWFSQQDADGGAMTAIDSGIVYTVNPRLALDAGLQFGISDDAPPFAAFAGISIVVGNGSGQGVRERQRRANVRNRHPHTASTTIQR